MKAKPPSSHLIIYKTNLQANKTGRMTVVKRQFSKFSAISRREQINVQ